MLCGEPRIPVLGVCFGHQLIAHLANAPIGFVDEHRTKVLGVAESHLAGGRLLPGEPVLRVVVSHREEVKRAPAEYRVTARRNHAPIDGLEHRALPIFSFQFHPEAREEFAGRAGIAPELLDDRLRRDSRRVIDAFLEVVGRRETPPGGVAP
jgi:GMP synthase-like glutamine amidotransferase